VTNVEQRYSAPKRGKRFPSVAEKRWKFRIPNPFLLLINNYQYREESAWRTRLGSVMYARNVEERSS